MDKINNHNKYRYENKYDWMITLYYTYEKNNIFDLDIINKIIKLENKILNMNEYIN